MTLFLWLVVWPRGAIGDPAEKPRFLAVDPRTRTRGVRTRASRRDDSRHPSRAADGGLPRDRRAALLGGRRGGGALERRRPRLDLADLVHAGAERAAAFHEQADGEARGRERLD